MAEGVDLSSRTGVRPERGVNLGFRVSKNSGRAKGVGGDGFSGEKGPQSALCENQRSSRAELASINRPIKRAVSSGGRPEERASEDG